MVPTLIMGGVILAFSQLIAYSWLKIPAEIGIMDALNSGKFSGFDLSLLKFAAVAVLRRRVVWFCHSDVCCFCGELYRWQTGSRLVLSAG